MASRSNMAAWSGCVTHGDDIFEKRRANTKASIFKKLLLFFHLSPNAQKVERKAKFSTTLIHSFVIATGLCHWSVLHNDTDGYRGGGGGGGGGGAVDDDVTWMRFQSCQSELSGVIRAGIFDSSVSPPSKVTCTAYTR